MPKYYNSTNFNVAIDGFSLGAKEFFTTNKFIDPLPAGVTKVADLPLYNPIIYSNDLTGDGTVTLPPGDYDYSMTLYMESGAADIRFSTATNDPPLKLGAGQSWTKKIRNRAINDIRVAFTAVGKIWILVEKE